MDSNPNSKPNLEEEEEDESRNWLELPEDIISMILQNLSAVDILENCQKVCCLWFKICKDPMMWRFIDMMNTGNQYRMQYDLEKMCRHAVDRSRGGLIYINLEHFGSDDLLHYISQSSKLLQRLVLVACRVSDESLIKAVSELPLLECLKITCCAFAPETLEAVGRCCPLLKSFTLNYNAYRAPYTYCDDEALAIARSMPKLHHLQMCGNCIADHGLQAILDGCPNLESLDLRLCIYLLGNPLLPSIRPGRIKNLLLPADPVDD